MKRFLAVLLLLTMLALLFGCEQEMDLSFLLSDTDAAHNTVPLTEQDCAEYIIVTDEAHPLFGELLSYYGKTDGDKGELYACESGYIYASSALRVSRSVSGSDLILSDKLWLLPDDSVRLRKAPSQDSETLTLLSGEDMLPVSAVSCTDALYYAVSFSDMYGYVSSALSHAAADLTELDFISLMKLYAPVGAQLTLINDGEIAGTYTYGLANIASGTDMTVDTKIRVASLSKVALGICAMKLHDEGAVDIDRNIGEYLQCGNVVNPSFSGTDITLRSILTHTSSIEPSLSYMSLGELKEHLCTAKAFDASKAPGTADAWEYNNFATGIGGCVLELASGSTLQKYLTAAVFSPLNIEAAYDAAALPHGSCALLYRQDGSLSRDVEEELVSLSDMIGENSELFAGGLYISSRDYAKLLLMLINDGVYDGRRILSKNSVSEMESVQLDTEEALGFSQCITLRKRRLYGRTLYYHTGNAYGTIAMASYDSETGDGVVFAATGADDSTAENGIYSICDSLCEKMYNEVLS